MDSVQMSAMSPTRVSLHYFRAFAGQRMASEYMCGARGRSGSVLAQLCPSTLPRASPLFLDRNGAVQQGIVFGSSGVLHSLKLPREGSPRRAIGLSARAFLEQGRYHSWQGKPLCTDCTDSAAGFPATCPGAAAQSAPRPQDHLRRGDVEKWRSESARGGSCALPFGVLVLVVRPSD